MDFRKYNIIDIETDRDFLDAILNEFSQFEIYSADTKEKLYVFQDNEVLRTVFYYDDGDKQELDFDYDDDGDIGLKPKLVDRLHRHCLAMLVR